MKTKKDQDYVKSTNTNRHKVFFISINNKIFLLILFFFNK